MTGHVSAEQGKEGSRTDAVDAPSMGVDPKGRDAADPAVAAVGRFLSSSRLDDWLGMMGGIAVVDGQ